MQYFCIYFRVIHLLMFLINFRMLNYVIFKLLSKTRKNILFLIIMELIQHENIKNQKWCFNEVFKFVIRTYENKSNDLPC